MPYVVNSPFQATAIFSDPAQGSIVADGAVQSVSGGASYSVSITRKAIVAVKKGHASWWR
jgi:hypothetical protein